MNIRKSGESICKQVIILFLVITLLNFLSSFTGAETIQYIYDEARQIRKVIYGDGTTIEYVYHNLTNHTGPSVYSLSSINEGHFTEPTNGSRV